MRFDLVRIKYQTTSPVILGALIALVFCLTSANAESDGTVVGMLIGPATAVFDTQTQSCELIDVPDAVPRAFRDAKNLVHLVSTHYVARAMVGPSLDSVKHTCQVLYRSSGDSDPSHYSDASWLMSFFSLDGNSIVALAHTEYHGSEFAGMCNSEHGSPNCWWNSVTFALSQDGGYTFVQPAPPDNLVAAISYRYSPENHLGAYGYREPSNILKLGSFYYALLNDWPYRAQKYGPCLIRTANPLDPSSWRAWDGEDFTMRFVDPYRYKPLTTEDGPDRHVCAPVSSGGMYEVESVVIHDSTGKFIANQFTPDNRFGPPGLYLSSSDDLIKWSKPRLVISTKELLQREGPGNWSYGYFSLLDPSSRDRNFSSISDDPYLYYVRFDNDHAPYRRTLFRRKIKISER